MIISSVFNISNNLTQKVPPVHKISELTTMYITVLDLSSYLHVVSDVEFSSAFHALLGILQGLTFLRDSTYLKIN